MGFICDDLSRYYTINLLYHPAKRAQIGRRGGLSTLATGMQMLLSSIMFDEQVPSFSGFQEPQIKRQLCAGASRFQLIQQFLVIDGLRPFCKWTFLINIFN